MSDEINFVDIMALSKIGPDSVVEKFGGMINSSFFDASNILGTLKVKGLIDFTTSFPGQSAITVTEAGKQLLSEAEAKSKEAFDPLDLTLLTQLFGGKKTLADLSGAVNLRPRDMALHLYKLLKMQYITSDFRNGLLDIALTEKGFLQVKEGMPKPATPSPQPAPQAPASGTLQAPASPPAGQVQIGAQQNNMQPNADMGIAPSSPQAQPVSEVEKIISDAKKRKAKRDMAIEFAIILVLVVLIILLKMKII
ncbi:MAG: hypothetical protein ACP5SJ_02770 [Candidatus Micrarchaeia archaeon]